MIDVKVEAIIFSPTVYGNVINKENIRWSIKDIKIYLVLYKLQKRETNWQFLQTIDSMNYKF